MKGVITVQVAEVMAKMGIDMSGFSKNLEQAQNKLQGFKDQAEKGLGPVMDKIGTAAKVAGAAVATGFGAMVMSGVKANSAMEQYRNTLNTVIGDSEVAAKKLDWVKQYAAKTPFEIPELVESTVKLEAMKLKAEEFIPVAADMAAVFQSSGKTVGDAAEAINDAMMGEFERLKEFGIKLGQTDFKEGGKYAGKTYAEAVLEEVRNHNYTGAADALGQTFEGRLSTLKDTFGQFIQKATTPIFDKLSTGLGDLMKRIDELQANGTLDKWADQATETMSALFDVAMSVGKAVGEVAMFIINKWPLIGPVLAGVLAGFMAYKAVTGVIAAVTAAQAALNLVMSLNPIGLIVIAVAALIAAGVALAQNWDVVGKKLSAIWEGIKSAFTAVWTAIKNFFSKFGDDFLLVAVGPAGWAVKLGTQIAKHWDDIKAGTQKAWDGIKNVVTGAWEKAMGILRAGFDKVKELFMKYHPIGIIIKHWEEIITFLRGIPGKMVEIGRNIIQGLINGIKAKGQALADAAKEAANKIPNWFKDKLGIKSPSLVFRAIGENIGAGLVLGLRAMEGDVQKAAHNMVALASPGLAAVGFASSVNSSNTMEHSGTIRVDGVDSQGQFFQVSELIYNDILERMAQDTRR